MTEITPETGFKDLMRSGAKVEFPGDYYCRGIIGEGYIEVGTQFGSDGLWDVDRPDCMQQIQHHLGTLAAADEATVPALTDTTTLSDLIQGGAKVGFADGTWLRGDLENRYIDVGTEYDGYSGCWDLNAKDGMSQALADIRKMAAALAPEADDNIALPQPR